MGWGGAGFKEGLMIRCERRITKERGQIVGSLYDAKKQKRKIEAKKKELARSRNYVGVRV